MVMYRMKKYKSSILVQGFEPFGHTKIRQPITKKLLDKAKNDDILKKLINIIENLKIDYENCSEEDVKKLIMSIFLNPKKL